MYINRGSLLTLILTAKRIFEFLNKHLHLILIISTLAQFTNNKIYKVISWTVKILVIINIMFGVGYIVYFSVIEESFVNGLTIYYDLIIDYKDYLIDLWNDLFNLGFEDNFIKDSTDNLKHKLILEKKV